MSYRHAGSDTLPQWLGIIILLVTVLFASAIPGYAKSGGGHRGGGQGFHSGHGGGGRGWHGGHGWRGHDWHGGHGWKGHGYHSKHGWGGVRFSIGVGPYWGPYWGPYGYPYVYAYPYTYPPPIYVQPSQPVPVPPPAAPPVWYYCDDPQGYYPYVQKCPGGWRTVPSNPQ